MISAREPLRVTLEHTGRASFLARLLLAYVPRSGSWIAPTLEELRRQSFDTLTLALPLSALGGALIAQQTGYQFQGPLPAWVIGSIVAASLVTEVTPLFCGFALVGMVGARITAELATMEVTDQIDALEVIGRDPVLHLIVPRVVASAIVGPLVVALCLPLSMLAGWLVSLSVTRASTADFWFGVRHYMRDFPMFFALIKGAAFSISVAFLSCYIGLETRGGSRGVGAAARRAIVAMIAAVVILDVALVPLLKIIRI